MSGSLKKRSSTEFQIAELRGGQVFLGRSDGSGDAGGAPESLTTDGTMSSAEVQFAQLCHDALQEAGDVSAAQRDAVLANLELRFEHPGEYVAYIDRYQLQNRIRRLSREILAHSADFDEVKAAFSHLDNERRAKIVVEYLDPLSGDFRMINDVRFR